MSNIQEALRPMRLKQRYPRIFELLGKVPPSHVQFALELLVNQLLDASPHVEKAAMLETSLEHPIGAMCAETIAVGNFVSFGRQCFAFSSNVTAALSRTKPGDVQLGDIQLPFPCIYLAFEAPIFVSTYYQCEGAYLWREEAGALFARIALTCSRSGWSDWLPDPGVTVPLGQSEMTVSDSVGKFASQLQALTEDTKKDPFAFMAKEWRAAPANKVLPSKPTSERIEGFLSADGDAFAACLAVVLGAACVLSALPEDVVNSVRTWPRPIQTRPGTSHRTVKGALPVRYIDFATDPAGSAEGTGGGISPRAHWRRGHWRRQAYGPIDSKVYRPRWIRPVLVNFGHGSAAETSIYEVRK